MMCLEVWGIRLHRCVIRSGSYTNVQATWSFFSSLLSLPKHVYFQISGTAGKNGFSVYLYPRVKQLELKAGCTCTLDTLEFNSSRCATETSKWIDFLAKYCYSESTIRRD